MERGIYAPGKSSDLILPDVQERGRYLLLFVNFLYVHDVVGC